MLTYSNALRHAQNEALIAFAGNNAKISIYQGTRPANANIAITDQTLLVTLQIDGVFGTDTNGTLTLGTVLNSTAVASGIMQFFRIFKADNTVIMDGTVGVTTGDMNFDTTAVVVSQQVAISSGTIIRANQ